MIKNNKTALIISSVLILLPSLFGIVLWNDLPDTMVSHWGPDGTPDGYMGKAMAVFLVPLILLALQWLCVLVTSKDTKNKNQNKKVMGMVLWIIPAISIVTNGIMYAIALGAQLSVQLVIVPVLSLTFALVGNYMPKCKQNNTIGIKTAHTLADEETWNVTHRLAGKLWFFGGLLSLSFVFLPTMLCLFAVVLCAITLGAVPAVYAYFYYQKKVKAGLAEPKPRLFASNGSRAAAVGGIVFTLLILLLCVFLIFTGDVSVSYSDDSFTVSTSYWGKSEISYSEIDEIEYREDFDYGTRLFGFGTPKLSAGSFKCDELGGYTCYAYTSCSAAVIIKVDDRFIVINGESSEQTIAIYNEISERLGE
ncbi:MAG: SdpI family protein [Clostridia bacterium]|nr:SdpI family protein [Clostridia bacterium]